MHVNVFLSSFQCCVLSLCALCQYDNVSYCLGVADSEDCKLVKYFVVSVLRSLLMRSGEINVTVGYFIDIMAKHCHMCGKQKISCSMLDYSNNTAAAHSTYSC